MPYRKPDPETGCALLVLFAVLLIGLTVGAVLAVALGWMQP